MRKLPPLRQQVSSQFKTKQFKELENRWYKKLLEKGFKDIEQRDSKGKSLDRLKTGPLENVVNLYSVEQFQIKEEYYRVAGQFLHEHKFKTNTEKLIWKHHSDGVSIRNIIKFLKKKGVTAYKDLVQGIINRLAEEMKTHARKK